MLPGVEEVCHKRNCPEGGEPPSSQPLVIKTTICEIHLTWDFTENEERAKVCSPIAIIFHHQKFILHSVWTLSLRLSLKPARCEKRLKYKLLFLHLKRGIDINPHFRMAKGAAAFLFSPYSISFTQYTAIKIPPRRVPPCPGAEANASLRLPPS